MRAALIALSFTEAAVFVAALVYYLLRIAATLQRSGATLAKITFGVRAVESQCRPLGSRVTTINAKLETIRTELGVLADLASKAAPPAPTPPRARRARS